MTSGNNTPTGKNSSFTRFDDAGRPVQPRNVGTPPVLPPVETDANAADSNSTIFFHVLKLIIDKFNVNVNVLQCFEIINLKIE